MRIIIFLLLSTLMMTCKSPFWDIFIYGHNSRIQQSTIYALQLWQQDFRIVTRPTFYSINISLATDLEPEVFATTIDRRIFVNTTTLFFNDTCLDNIIAHEFGHIIDLTTISDTEQYHVEGGLMRPFITGEVCEKSHLNIMPQDINVVYDK